MADMPIALVTGASRGLGPEVARQLGARGYRLLVTARRASDAEATLATLSHPEREHLALPLDVRDAASIAALVGTLAERGGLLDLLVNNAGIALRGFDGDVVRQTVDTNYYGALQVTLALLGRIRDGGAITMVSSGMGALDAFSRPLRQRFSDPDLTIAGVGELVEEFARAVDAGTHREAGWPSSAYRVSKAAMNALTRVLARELAPRRIRVNAVCPGWVHTDLGGRSAPRDIPNGARSIVATALAPEVSGGFFRDGAPIAF